MEFKQKDQWKRVYFFFCLIYHVEIKIFRTWENSVHAFYTSFNIWLLTKEQVLLEQLSLQQFWLCLDHKMTDLHASCHLKL